MESPPAESSAASLLGTVTTLVQDTQVDVTRLIEPSAIKDSLVRQAAAPVRWVEIMQAMQADGVTHVLECGPGKVLAGLAKRCADGLVGVPMADLAGLDAALLTLKGA